MDDARQCIVSGVADHMPTPRVRHEYLLTFSKVAVPDRVEGAIGFETRIPSRLDVGRLAELMLDAYQGTIDYEGETIREASKEADSYFTRQDAIPMLAYSLLAVSGDRIVSACLVSKWEKRPEPLIAYIMTSGEHKGRGLATALTRSVVKRIQGAGHIGVRAVVTDGNKPSERIMESLGFARVT